MQLFLRYKSWQRENTLTCLFRLASANLVMLLRLVPSLNKLTVNKNDELLCKKASSSMNCLKNDRIWKPRLVLRHPTWAYTLLLLVCCCRGFRIFAPSGSFRVLFYIMLKIPEISVGIQMEGPFRFLLTGIFGITSEVVHLIRSENFDRISPFHFDKTVLSRN